jgi:uncharacterized protein (DUF342 family)
VASTLAEKAVEHLAGVIAGRIGTPAASRPVGADETLQAQIEGLKETVQQHEQRLSALAAALEGLGAALRPLILRAAVAFWTSLAAIAMSIAALIVAILR